MSMNIRDFRELRVYDAAMYAAMEIFRITSDFPKEEKYSLTDQVRRSSRSVCSNIAEAWRKRRYRAAFIAKLSDAESEAAETQVWLEFADKCEYIKGEIRKDLGMSYDRILTQLVHMIHNADDWTIRDKAKLK
ncbi:hypothetical protein BMS3Abin14_00938 [bacterium BMS3Abin14]|nr:hypothetical protein BMS3Abin14_00938 [bacterium BMS3Abin14]